MIVKDKIADHFLPRPKFIVTSVRRTKKEAKTIGL
jgi:hypothetical protein